MSLREFARRCRTMEPGRRELTPALIPAPRSQERGHSSLCNISYGNLPVGLGNCPDICVRRLAERDAGYSLKGVKSPPPQGQTVNSPKSPQRWLFWRYGALTPLAAESGTRGQHCPHGQHQINNATMQVTPMVIFLFCKDAMIYNAERTDCNVAIFIWGSAKTISYWALW